MIIYNNDISDLGRSTRRRSLSFLLNPDRGVSPTPAVFVAFIVPEGAWMGIRILFYELCIRHNRTYIMHYACYDIMVNKELYVYVYIIYICIFI